MVEEYISAPDCCVVMRKCDSVKKIKRKGILWVMVGVRIRHLILIENPGQQVLVHLLVSKG